MRLWLTLISDPPLYLSLRALLDKLFGAIISLQDEVFVRSFFMTYRRFCTSAEVMQEFLDRFREVRRPGVSKDVQMWAQQKSVSGPGRSERVSKLKHAVE